LETLVGSSRAAALADARVAAEVERNGSDDTATAQHDGPRTGIRERDTRSEKIIAVKTARDADSAALTFPHPTRNISCP
jgi:hypothetical protein